MATEYAKDYTVPAAFPDVLREFARETVRSNPADVNAFAYQYFLGLHSGKSMQSQAAAAPQVQPRLRVSINNGSKNEEVEDAEPPRPIGLSTEMLQDRISLLFSEADSDGNGHLSRREFADIFGMLAGELGLSEKDVLLVMAEADENDDGVIEYAEFVPVAADLVVTLMAKERYNEARQMRASGRSEAKDYLMKGMPREELEDAIRDVFRSVDGDGNGTLDRSEFAQCLRHSGLGFTRRELNLILTMVDKNGDGVIDYEEFVPICFGMLVEGVSQRLTEVPAEETALRRYIEQKLDELAGPGERIAPNDGLRCIKAADLGLTLVQVHAISSECQESPADGTISRQELAAVCAGVILGLQEVQGTALVQKYMSIAPADATVEVAGCTRESFQERLEAALAARDPAGDGALAQREDMRLAIAEAFPEFDEKQTAALLSLAEKVGAGGDGGNGGRDGGWNYQPVLVWGFRTLQNLLRHNFLMSEHRSKSMADGA